MVDVKAIKELGRSCRPLVIILSCGYCVNVVILVIALIDSSSTPRKNHFESEIHYGVLTVISFLAAISSAIFITTTYIKSFWLSLPYLVMHIFILIYCLFLFVYLQWNKGFKGYKTIVLDYYGSYEVFISVVAFCLLMYTTIPLWKFTNACWHIREERIERERPGRVAPAETLTVPEAHDGMMMAHGVHSGERRTSVYPTVRKSMRVDDRRDDIEESFPMVGGSHRPKKSTSDKDHRKSVARPYQQDPYS